MISDKCKHNWKLLKDSTFNPLNGLEYPTKYSCTRCNNILTAIEVYQLETLNYISGIQKMITLASLVISIVALFVATFVAIYK